MKDEGKEEGGVYIPSSPPPPVLSLEGPRRTKLMRVKLRNLNKQAYGLPLLKFLDRGGEGHMTSF
jgi:hypothetical protein